MSYANDCENRLRAMIVGDKKENPMKIERVLKSELIYVLKNYLDVLSEDVDLNICINDDGLYELNLNVVSRNIKVAKIF